ncbi:putative plexin-A4 [Apostichopus japonicus]|uniref:Putative plexin-A4 n=1 Tax=Stichopus japonicus TaxID=307972 RepID=A0A2G8KLA3_STIJA|nr:putative plexin-A4 [Apostichopus japonicus]
MNGDDDYNLIQSAHLASLSLDGDKELKDVLVASFSKSESHTSPTPSSESAICIYPVDDINQAFYDRRLDCAQQGTDNTEISWAGSRDCSINQFLFNIISQSSPADNCHTLETQSPLGGDNRAIIISARPVYESTNYITAVAAVQQFETPIIFTGGDSGNFKKMRLNGSSAELYESLDLHETPVIRNGLLLSEDGEFIFITSEDQCTLKCTRRIDAQCQGSQNGTSLRWLSSENDCLEITGVTPKFAPSGTTTKSCPLIRTTEEVLIPAGQSQELQFEGINLPNDSFQFSCQIQYTGLQRHIIPASIVDDQIRCQTNLYNYSSTAESISGSVVIFWGNFPIDMEGNLTVTIYKCNRMAVTILNGESKPTCGMCLIVDQRYGCSWCPTLNDCLSPMDANTCPTNELLEQNSSDEIICRTGSANVTDNLLLSVNFDLGCEYNGDIFAYLQDPIVASFDRLSAIASGGLDLTIFGASFDIIQTARLEVRIGSDTVSGDCSNCSDSTMKLICKSPNISVAQTDYPLLLPTSNFSLYMDGVTRYINFGMFFPGSLKTAFEFVEDPVYYLLPSAENIIKVPNEFQGQYNITIQGDNLTLASNSEDVSVIIGGKACFVSNLFINYLICQPPKLSEGVHQVQVQHGNLNFVVGPVEYLGPDQTPALPILMCSCVLMVALFCFCLLVLYRRSLSVRHSYHYKNSRQISRNTGMDDDNVSDYTYCSQEMDYFSISIAAATNAKPPTLPERNRATKLFRLKSKVSTDIGKSSSKRDKSGPDISLETGKEQQLPIHPKRNMSRKNEEMHEGDRKQQRPTISEEDDEYSKRIYNDHSVSKPVGNPYSRHIHPNNRRNTTGD